MLEDLTREYPHVVITVINIDDIVISSFRQQPAIFFVISIVLILKGISLIIV